MEVDTHTEARIRSPANDMVGPPGQHGSPMTISTANGTPANGTPVNGTQLNGNSVDKKSTSPETMQPRPQSSHATKAPDQQAPASAVPSTDLAALATKPMPLPTPSASSPPPRPSFHSPQQPPQQSQQARNNTPAQRFASPEVDHSLHTPRFDRDLALLSDDIRQCRPEAIRRIVRDNWEKCVMGSEFHSAFLLNAVIHHASGNITRRAVRDFGRNLVKDARSEIADHLSTADIDVIGDTLLSKCSDHFLDKAMELRLKSIDARSLINALARAERLGYEANDILDDQPKERVMPGSSTIPQLIAPQAAPPPKVVATPTQSQYFPRLTPSSASLPIAELTCRLCWRKFDHPKGYEYHVQKSVCNKPPPTPAGFPFVCKFCGCGFITKVGLTYHNVNAVCGVHETAPATPRSDAIRPPPSQPTALPHHPHQPSTPRQHNASFQPPPSSVDTDDPYSHLNAKRKAELNEELRQAEINYAPRFKEAEEIPDLNERKLKVAGLQNSFSTKQSIIRKKYGVRLRNRRTRAEIEEERSRLGLKEAHSPPSSAYETPLAKRQRTDLTWQPYPSSSAPIHPPPTPSNHMSVSEMGSGLGGTNATAAMNDPTQRPPPPPPLPALPRTMPSPVSSPQPPTQNSLSSLQRKGYRVSSHVGQQSGADSPSSVPTGTPNPDLQRSGSVAAPVVLDDSSDDEAGSDEEIPATLPPRKPT
ncbi:hypothetical protein F5Y18DRAFT_216164 [Xylariaceae sp. FL1019]|nr:hypothetical protein F5Y18DRAFT_216164 [Xylariaceae sp. FL1019]